MVHADDGAVNASQDLEAVAARPWIWRFPNWFVETICVSAIVSLIYGALYRPWGWRSTLPLSYTGDGNFYAMLVKTMQETGGYETTSRLGAPHGQYLFDFPLGGDHLHLLAAKVLSVVIGDPYVVINTYFAIGFLLVALCAYFVARAMELRPLTSAVISVLYAFSPYHFWHGVPHIFLSAYYAAPLGILLVIWILDDGIPIFGASAHSWTPKHRRTRLLAIVFLAIVVGSASSYYAVFVVIVLAGAGAIDALRKGTWNSIAAATLLVAVIGCAQVVNVSSELRYRAQHGANSAVSARGAAESEFYGLHLTRLIVPPPTHRVSQLAKLGLRSVRVGYVGEDDSYLGIFGAIGFVVTAALVLAAMLRGPPNWWVPALVRQLGLVIFLSLLVATVGGVGFFIAILGFTQIRGWSRMTVVIAFASLVALGALVERVVLPRWSGSMVGRITTGALAVAIMAIGVADQVPRGFRGDQIAIQAAEQSDKAFVAQMEQALPRDGMVFELPAMPFPENGPIANLLDYDLLKGYLLGTGRLRWSYGGIRNRIADWQQTWAAQPVPRMINGLAAAGFSALYVDRTGFTDSGASLDSLLRPVVGPPASQSQDGRLRWYDLRSAHHELVARVGSSQVAAVGDAVTNPVVASFEGGIYGEEQAPDGHFHWMSTSGTIDLLNSARTPRQVVQHLSVSGPLGGHLTIRGGGVDTSIPLGAAATPVDLGLTVRPGITSLRLATDAPSVPAPGDSRNLRLRLVGVTTTDPLVDRLLLPG